MYAEHAYFGPHDPHLMIGNPQSMIGSSNNLYDPAIARMGIGLGGEHELRHHQLPQAEAFPDLPFPSISFDYSNSRRASNFLAPPEYYAFGEVQLACSSPFSPAPAERHHLLPSQQSLWRDELHLNSTGHEYCGDRDYMRDSDLNMVLGFGNAAAAGGRGGGEGKPSKGAEKQRRGQMSEKFNDLRSLIPNPTKKDRASIISDATDYIKELLRTVEELKTLVHRRWCREGMGSRKKPKLGDETDVGITGRHSEIPVEQEETKGGVPIVSSLGGSLRSSWIQRRSKETFVDVRIVEDEVNIRFSQRRRVRCLLFVAKALHEMELEVLHLASGNIGDYHSFMINTKMNESSNVYASAIAERLIEAMDV